MPIPIPQPDVFSISPILQAHQVGTQMRYQGEDREAAREQERRQAIARLAYQADTPEEWGSFIEAIGRRFPDVDLSEYQDFANRDAAIGDGLTLEGAINLDFNQRNWDQGQADRARADAQAAALRTGLTGLIEGQPVPTVDPNNPNWMRAGSGVTGTNAPPVIDYANQDQIRNDPISGQLSNAISAAAAEAGIDRVVVTSGGQEAAGEGGARTGSTRHDHGNAADVELYVGGRLLDQSNPADQAIYQRFVTAAASNGVTGIGAGEGYMGNTRIHVGFGDPAVWGAGGTGETAPEWLRTAYNAASRERTGGVPLSDQQRTLVHALIDGGQTDAALQIITQAMQPPEPTEFGFTEVNGTLLRTDPRRGTADPVFAAAPGQGDPTDDIQEYEFYAQQERAAGRSPKSFEQWQLQRPPTTTITNNNGPTGIDYGDAPTDYAWARNPDGTVRLDERNAPIALPIGPELAAQQAEEERATRARETYVADSQNVLRTIDNALDLATGGNVGFFGGLFGRFELGTPQYALNQLLGTVATNVGINEIQQMRDNSPTGGAVGQVTVQEWERFERAIQSLRQGLPETQLRESLYEVKASFFDAIHGTGNWFYDDQGNVMLRTADGVVPYSYQRPIDQLPPELRPQAINSAAPVTTPTGTAPAVRNPLQAGLLPLTELTPQNYNDAYQNAIKPISEGGRGLTQEQAINAIAGQFGLTAEQMFQRLGQTGAR